MEAKDNAAVSRRWRTIALVAVGVAIGSTLTATPVYSHVGGTVTHLWTKHIRPKTDARYPTKAAAERLYVNVGEKASDAELFDGMDSNVFVTGSTPAGGDLTGSYPNPSIGPDAISGAEVYEPSLATVPSAANAERLGGLSPAAFMRMTTKWKTVNTTGERYPIEIGHPACGDGDSQCYASLRCDPGDVLLSGGFNNIDSGTRLWQARPFNANGYDHKYILVWDNNSTADTVTIDIICADQ